MLDLRDQTFGMELEFTGITRSQAAQIISRCFSGSRITNCDNGYDEKHVHAPDGKIWKVMRDGSIEQTDRNGSSAGDAYKCEFVTPICKYEDLNKVQEIVRELRKAGAKVNDSCGLHVHIGGDKHTPQSLTRLTFNIWAREDIMHKALNVAPSRAGRWCRKVSQHFIDLLKERKPQTKQELADCWYDENTSESRSNHYNSSRYRTLNLHSYFTKGTVEFRCFNSTLHAGEVKSYIQFCLGASAQAINQKQIGCHKKTASSNECYTFRTWLIKIPLNGDEFKTCRNHLLKNLVGARDWKDKAAAMRRRAERAAEVREYIDRMRDEQGQPLTAEQIISQPEREDPSQGITTRQQIIMLLEDMRDESIEPAERDQLLNALGLNPQARQGQQQGQEATQGNAILNWLNIGSEAPAPQQEQSENRGRRR